jgi:hypothetical protein
MTQLFRALHITPALSLLPSDVTINGVTKSPVVRYYGKDAGASAWTASIGQNLAIASSGTAPTLNAHTPIPNDVDKAVEFNSGQVYQAPDGSVADVGAEDFFFEALIKTGAGAAFAKRGTGAFFELISNPISSLQLQVGDGVLATAQCTINPGSHEVWLYVCGFFDLSDTANTGMRLSTQGGAQSGVSTHPAYSSLSNSNAFTIGSRSDFTQKFPSEVAYFALYKGADWFAGGATNTTHWTAIEKERFHTLMGLAAESLTNGTQLPSLVTRTTLGHVDRIVNKTTDERRPFYTGQGWPRQGERKEVSGGEYFRGVLIEPARTNVCLQSQTFGTTWTKINASDTHDSDIVTAPDGSNAGDKLRIPADAVGTEHGFRQNITLTSNRHFFSVWVKKANYTWVYLRNATIANGAAWFNLDTGSLGTRQSGLVTSGIENWGNGWFRIWIVYSGTAASHSHDIGAATADATTTFTTGATTDGYYVWGAQVEASAVGTQSLVPSSYIITTTASATRAADFIQYLATGNVANAGRTLIKALGGASAMVNNAYMVEVGPSTAERNIVYQGGSAVGNAAWTGVTGSSQGSIVSGPASVVGGEIHEVEAVYRTNSVKVAVDGAFGSTDTTENMPSIETGSTIFVGNSRVGTEAPGYMLADLRFDDGFGLLNAAAIGGGSSIGSIELSLNITAPRVMNITPAATSVVIEFDDNLALVSDAATASKWKIESAGNPAVAVTGISVNGKFVTLTTTEHKQGASYTLTIPFYILRLVDGAIMPIGYTQSYTGVGVVPTLVAARGVDARTIEVTFSEPVMESDALTASNYTITAGGSVTVLSVTKVTDITYRLTTTEQARNNAYTIQVSNVRDKAGNPV